MVKGKFNTKTIINSIVVKCLLYWFRHFSYYFNWSFHLSLTVCSVFRLKFSKMLSSPLMTSTFLQSWDHLVYGRLYINQIYAIPILVIRVAFSLKWCVFQIRQTTPNYEQKMRNRLAVCCCGKTVRFGRSPLTSLNTNRSASGQTQGWRSLLRELLFTL